MEIGSWNESDNGGFDGVSNTVGDCVVVMAQSFGDLGVEVDGAGIGESDGDAEQFGP